MVFIYIALFGKNKVVEFVTV